jgi:hypothetical protein
MLQGKLTRDFHEKMNEPSESDESLGIRDTNFRDDSGVR